MLAHAAFRLEKANRPDALLQYLAAVACEVRRSWVKDPHNVSLEPFKLKFGQGAAPILGEEAVQHSQAMWRTMMFRSGPRPYGRPKKPKGSKAEGRQ